MKSGHRESINALTANSYNDAASPIFARLRIQRKQWKDSMLHRSLAEVLLKKINESISNQT